MTFTPRTWTVGEVVTASHLNTEVRDQFNSMFAAWTSYTPNWLAEGGAAPTLGNGSIVGRYLKVGRTVDWVLQLTWGSTTAAGGGGGSENWMFGLPPFLPATGFTYRIVNVDAFRASTSLHYSGNAIYSNTFAGVIKTLVSNRADASGIWDSSLPFVFAAGDILYASGRYESAV